MAQYRTKADHVMNAWGVMITLPKGTKVHDVGGRFGKPSYVVSDPALLIRLTGNTHDPKYRYVWIPLDLVEDAP